MPKPQIDNFGWTAVPRNRCNIPSEDTAKTEPASVPFQSIWPRSALVSKAQDYIKHRLPQETYNHSLRVYAYGHVMVTQHFQSWIASHEVEFPFFETWALTCLFHDLGTTVESRESTHMSFEFQGGFLALQQLQELGAPKAQAESVCEAIIRHQDPGETGMISRLGQLIQIATEFGKRCDLHIH